MVSSHIYIFFKSSEESMSILDRQGCDVLKELSYKCNKLDVGPVLHEI